MHEVRQVQRGWKPAETVRALMGAYQSVKP